MTVSKKKCKCLDEYQKTCLRLGKSVRRAVEKQHIKEMESVFGAPDEAPEEHTSIFSRFVNWIEAD